MLVFIIASVQDMFSQTKEQWTEDIDFLVQKYETGYPRFYQQVDSAKFCALVEKIVADIQPNDPNHNIMNLFQMHAFLKDAHSIPMVFHPSYNLHAFPIRLHKFKEGWYIVDAMLGYKDLIGLKLKNIQGVDIETVFNKSGQYVSSENEYGKTDRFEMFGLMAEWLYDQKIIPNVEIAQFELVDDQGKVFQRAISSTKYVDFFKWVNMTPLENNSSFALFNLRKQNYWYTYDRDKKTLYFQFNSVDNQEGEPTIAEFAQSMRKTIKREKVEKIIIDLRNNSGGNDSNLPPLLSLFRDNRKINRYGKLFVITGPHTFSSGLLFAWKLRLQTEAILVGEPSAQGPVFNANAAYVFLPNSKIGFTISSTSTARNQPNWCFKPPQILKVDIPVQYGIHDFITNCDPALALIDKTQISSPDRCDEMGLSGSYQLSDFHVLTIEPQKEGLSMTITDFMNNSLFFVSKQLYSTDQAGIFADKNHVFVVQKTGDMEVLQVSFNGQNILAKKRTAGDMLPMEAMQQKDYAKALSMFQANADVYKQGYIKFEFYLTMAGYNLLKAGDIEMSLRFFELLINTFPNSWNAYDSYGEALAKAGQNKKAIKNFKKSLELNPENESGKKWLETLEKSN